ncbi:MAG: GNAT family N-acetyltransferase [Oscillospiraceae bacterium]|jgi:predicted GNAT family acetyltransferase|nr:GNAT family N-acetyltransferase [Oscillospiraceae bacterium]
MNETYICKLDSIEQLIPHETDKVRWIDTISDLDMLRAYCEWFDVVDLKEDYFGFDITKQFGTEQRKWRVCAYIDGSEILSLARVKFVSEQEWEISAGSTHPHYRGRGYMTAVASFLAKYILENHKRAICCTNIGNVAAQKVMHQIGMVFERIEL